MGYCHVIPFGIRPFPKDGTHFVSGLKKTQVSGTNLVQDPLSQHRQ